MPSLYGIIIRHGVRIHLLNSSSFRDNRGFQKSSSRRDLDTETGSPTKRRGKASTAQVHKRLWGTCALVAPRRWGYSWLRIAKPINDSHGNL
jgi:hypothetical protein